MSTGTSFARLDIVDRSSDRDELTVLAPGHAEAIADLTDRGVGTDGCQDGRHEVALAPGDPLELLHGRRPSLGRALGPHPADPLDLAALAVGVDLVGRR